MIQHLLLVPLLMLASSGIAQIEQQFNFDDGSIGDVHIDTTDGHGGLWQIGTPQKQMFTSPYSSPNVIVTDTQHSYPPNDTSRFTIVHIAEGGWMSACCAISLTGYYQVDADSLNDFGTMEFSYAPLSAWIDVIHDPIFAPMVDWGSSIPTLTGTSNGWRYFGLNLGQVAYYIQSSLGHQVQWGDTIQWRFSFFSDSMDNDRDGLMFDDLNFVDYAESILEYPANTFHSTVAPMPVANELNLIYETAGLDKLDLTIRDARGTMVRREGIRAEHGSRIDIHDLAAGLYMYSIHANNGHDRSTGRFVKE